MEADREEQMGGEYPGEWNSSMGLSWKLMGMSLVGMKESGNQEPRES